MKIMLCTDGSPHAQAALRFGAMIARHSPVPTTLLGVLKKASEHTPLLESALEEGRRLLEDAPNRSAISTSTLFPFLVRDERE